MNSPASRIHAIAINTVREAIRSKLLYTLLFFADRLIIGLGRAGVRLSPTSRTHPDPPGHRAGGAIRGFGVVIAIFVGVGPDPQGGRPAHGVSRSSRSRCRVPTFLLGKVSWGSYPHALDADGRSWSRGLRQPSPWDERRAPGRLDTHAAFLILTWRRSWPSWWPSPRSSPPSPPRCWPRSSPAGPVDRRSPHTRPARHRCQRPRHPSRWPQVTQAACTGSLPDLRELQPHHRGGAPAGGGGIRRRGSPRVYGAGYTSGPAGHGRSRPLRAARLPLIAPKARSGR